MQPPECPHNPTSLHQTSEIQVRSGREKTRHRIDAQHKDKCPQVSSKMIERGKMEMKFTFWLITLLVGVSFWFYKNLKLEIDYERHPQLIDPTTGSKMKPSDLLDLTKIINKSEAYINSTNAQERLYELEYYSNFENPFLIDHTYSREEDLIQSGYPVANATQCGLDLGWLLGQLAAHKNYTFLRGRLGYELTALMDSFGRPESGLYSGMVNWLGSYKQCQAATLDGGRVRSRYCIGRLRPRWWPRNEAIYPPTSLRMGLCLPESCDTRSFGAHNSSIGTLAKWELPELYKDGLDLVSMFCLPDERSPIRRIPTGGLIYLAILGGWCLLVLGATVANAALKRSRGAREPSKVMANSLDKMISMEAQLEPPPATTEKILAALSLRSSLKTLKTNSFRVRYARGERVRVDLNPLDFWRVFMAIMVVLGHSAYLGQIYSRSLANRLEMGAAASGKMALSVSRCVDTFFLFFGLLTTYNLMRKFDARRLASPLVWLAVNLGIFMRIAPVFMLVYWYARLVSPYTGSGPWWDYGVDKYSMKGVCMSDAWWKSVPYLGSLGTPPVPSCLLPGWFIVSYSQLSLLLPLVTYIICGLSSSLRRSAFAGFLLLASALSVGARLHAQTSVREEGFTLYGGLLSDLLEKFESTGHLTTLSRLGSSSVGCLVGYLLRRYELGSIGEWPRWMRRRSTALLAAALSLLLVFLPLLGHYHFLLTGRLVTLREFVLSNVLLIVVWPALNGLLILLACTLYSHTAPVRFCGHSFWRAFNKLSFAIFLVHWEVLFVGTTLFEQAPTHGFVTDIMKMWASGVSLSIVIALLIYLFIEAPIARLLAILVECLSPPGANSKGLQQQQLGGGEKASAQLADVTR